MGGLSSIFIGSSQFELVAQIPKTEDIEENNIALKISMMHPTLHEGTSTMHPTLHEGISTMHTCHV